ncbi:hypothetical protein [Cognatishimia sp. F0-27]|uniref:hypothetical protein n=1 Tax=Cognatishimia sp. F0-27 TaxID=2816855 RepID=UPI001D0CBC5D|nr:hypothetical protein [Cognatishimia sp. F0-27]MCC1492800.1 hypothetical protein [Cognatishimia sp. F0-27]
MAKFSKPVLFGLLVAAGAVITGLLGAAHNQLSFSVGASYFHDVAFPRSGISADTNERLAAALVGWRSGWWMGALMGVPVFGAAALLLPRRSLVPVGVFAGAVTLLWALGGAMIGLVLGMIAPGYASHLPIPEGISDTDGFLRAALMHEGAFLGAIIGVAFALATVWRARVVTLRALRARQSGSPAAVPTAAMPAAGAAPNTTTPSDAPLPDETRGPTDT